MTFHRLHTLRSALLMGASLLLCSPAAYAAGADGPSPEPASVSAGSVATVKLDKATATFGLAFAQATYKTFHPGIKHNTQITDNGAASLILGVTTREKELISWPMQSGGGFIGWDIDTALSFFDTRYQLVNSAFRGDDIGTRVSGGYLGVAPTLFLKMGPLYPGRDIYWKVGYGIGPGLFKGSGTAQFSVPGGTEIHSVGSSNVELALYNTASWQLQMDRWNFHIMGKWLLVQDGHDTTLETYGFGVSYRFVF